MGPIWGRQDPGGPHVDPMNLAIWEDMCSCKELGHGHYVGLWIVAYSARYHRLIIYTSICVSSARVHRMMNRLFQSRVLRTRNFFGSHHQQGVCHLDPGRKWWSHDMERLFPLLAVCEGNPLVTGGSPYQGPVILVLCLMITWISCWTNTRMTVGVKLMWRHCNDEIVGYKASPTLTTPTGHLSSGLFSPGQLLLNERWKIHDDVIKWKHFPRYWPFVRGIHRSPVNSPHKGQAELWCLLWSAPE